MSYTVKQKIGGKLYAYEAHSYWDPKKKQSRQKRRYLGVWDESTGEIIPKAAERDVVNGGVKLSNYGGIKLTT